MDQQTAEFFERTIRKDGRFPPVAYEFLHRGLERATQVVHGDLDPARPRHVSGRQLCEALRDLALERWGYLAGTVLDRWNIRRTRDFGEMVYFLVELGLMGRQDSDRIEDFDDVYELDEAFGDYEIPLDNF